jgi:NTP pyrophosphatase (non-canonical NTP hydrolase)
MAISTLDHVMQDIVRVGRTVDPALWTPADVLAKLLEEGGELSTAVQIKNGKLPTKTQEDGEEFDECADVINCAVDAVSQVNRDLSPEEIIDRIRDSLVQKNKKWKAGIDKGFQKPTSDDILSKVNFNDTFLGKDKEFIQNFYDLQHALSKFSISEVTKNVLDDHYTTVGVNLIVKDKDGNEFTLKCSLGKFTLDKLFGYGKES